MHPRERTWISRRVMVFLLLGIIAIGLGSAFGQGEKPATSEEESSDIILVVKGKNSGGELAALGGAVVNVFDSRGKQHQQKTTTNGRTIIKDLPRGKVRVQVIAPEWELFGQDYDLTQKKHEFSIEMEKRKSE